NRDMSIFIPGWLILILYAALVFYLVKFFTWLLDGTRKTQQLTSVILIVALIALYFAGKISDFKQDVIPASWFQSINAVGIVILAPLFTILWGVLGRKNREPSSPMKMAFGLFFLCLGYAV